jgi:hypothetical protein
MCAKMELLGRKREPFFVSSLKMIEPRLACSILNMLATFTILALKVGRLLLTCNFIAMLHLGTWSLCDSVGVTRNNH